MISRLHVDALRLHVQPGLDDGADLHLGDLGIGDAQPAAAVAEHRVELGQLVHAHADPGQRHARSCCAITFWPASSCGRNSCSGGSSRRIVTGRPFIARKMPSKSSRWNGSSLASALRRPASSSARIISRIGVDALALEEHVLGAAQADALGAEVARHAWRLPACRHWCALPARGTCRPSAISLLEVAARASASLVAISPAMTSPVEPFDATATSPSAKVRSPMLMVRAFASIVHSRRHPTRSTCPCRARRPPRGWSCRRVLVRMPRRHVHAAQVFGDGFLAHQDHRLALLGPGVGLVGVEDDLPDGGARAGRQAAWR